jgi:hypothetical protein
MSGDDTSVQERKALMRSSASRCSADCTCSSTASWIREYRQSQLPLKDRGHPQPEKLDCGNQKSESALIATDRSGFSSNRQVFNLHARAIIW